MQKLTLFLNGIIVLSVACGNGEDPLILSGSPRGAEEEQELRLVSPWQNTNLPKDGGVLPPTQEARGDESESEAESESESESEAGAKTGEPSCNEPPNRVRGGSFETQPFTDCGWQTYDVMDWGIIAMQECGLEDHPGCAALLGSDVWGDDWVAEFYQYLDLEPGRTYHLSFEARADREPRVMIVALLGAGPEGGLGNGLDVWLWTDEWTTFENTFVAAGDAALYSQLVFAIGGTETYLYLDNVEIVPIKDGVPRGE